MGELANIVGRAQARLHRYFLALLVAAYSLAAAWPVLGEALRAATLARVVLVGTESVVTAPPLLLGCRSSTPAGPLI